MNWVWFIGGTWVVAGVAVATVIGRLIHLATLTAEDGHQGDVAKVGAPYPAAGAAIELHSASIRRTNPSPTASGRSPPIAGCLSSADRAPAEHEPQLG